MFQKVESGSDVFVVVLIWLLGYWSSAVNELFKKMIGKRERRIMIQKMHYFIVKD